MTDDRDRRAAHEWLVDALHCDEMERVSPELESRLAALLTAARAEGAAEAIEAAVRTLHDRIDVATVAFGEDSDAVRCLTDSLARTRALAPAGLVAVDPADLEMALPLAEGGPADYQQPSAWRDAHRRLRAAVARKGE